MIDQDYKNGWRYIVWVDGNDDYYKTFSLAQMDYHNWREKGYDVCLTEIQKTELKRLYIIQKRIDIYILFKLSLDCTEQYRELLFAQVGESFYFPLSLFNHFEVSVNERRGVVFTKFRKSSNNFITRKFI